jgi:serine/threonine-protein kinase
VVAVIDAGEDGGHPYIVFEYVEGETLKQRIARLGALDPQEALAYAIEIARGLTVAHGRNMVHRDIKPQNVLIDAEGRAKLTDFGISRQLEQDGMTATGRVLGTTDYVAPEQAMGHAVDPRSDIYSLGVVLYELLTGQAPFEADTLPELMVQREQGLVTPPREVVPEIPRALEAVVMRCLALRPEYRPASAAALAAELNGTSDTHTTAVLPLPARPAPGRRRRVFAIAAGIAILAAAAVLAVALATSGGGDKAATSTTSSQKTTTTTPTTTPTTAPTTTASAPQPPPPATPAEALAATQATIVAAQANGQIDPSQAADLTNRLDDIARALEKPNANDASHKVDDLRSRLDDLVNGEQLSNAGFAAISAPLDRLAALLPPKGHGHDKHGDNS